jgi:tyrosinase
VLTGQYYNWGMWADNPKASPLLDGSDTSISGDGSFYPHGDTLIPPEQSVFSFPAQNGGGCINSGPFLK